MVHAKTVVKTHWPRGTQWSGNMLSSENPRKTQEPTRSPPGAHAKTVVKTHLDKKEPTGAHTITWKNTGAHTFHPLGNIIIFH